MHFHLPKPLHGWRELVGEVGIIVVGVLIALGAEQVVESWQWHEKVGVVRKSLMGELANDRARWEVDMIDARCGLRQISQLDRWAQVGASATPSVSISSIGPSRFFWMHSANWNLATGSQTLDHFPIDEQLALAALYDGVAHRQIDIEKATDLTDRIRSLIPLLADAQGRRELRETLGSLREKIGALTSNDAYMTRHFDALGVKADRSDFAADFTGATCAF
jgi:hypothetical protein